MQKMKLEYAKKLLDGGYAYGNKFFSYTDGLLVIEDTEADYFHGTIYYGTHVIDGKFIDLDSKTGHVIFRQVKPVIDKTTRFS